MLNNKNFMNINSIYQQNKITCSENKTQWTKQSHWKKLLTSTIFFLSIIIFQIRPFKQRELKRPPRRYKYLPGGTWSNYH